VPLDSFKEKAKRKQRKLNLDVIYLPHISNFTDFDGLEKEPDVSLRYVKRPEELINSDIIIIPGTKNTISDLKYLVTSGFTKKILAVINSNKISQVVGICGGYQILGNRISDKNGLESKCKRIQGLNLLPIETILKTDKILAQVKARDLISGLELSGYEIHHGQSRIMGDCNPVFEIIERNGRKSNQAEGAISSDSRILGTYIHGIFETEAFRRDFLNRLRVKKGWGVLQAKGRFSLDNEFDKLAKLVRENIDTDLLYKIMKGKLR
jgi:adenosylcobyric acid synthase